MKTPALLKKILSVLLVLIIGGTLLISCTPNDVSNDASDTVSEGAVTNNDNIALGASYAYSYGIKITDDSTLCVLTDGKKDEFVTIKTSLKKSEDTDYTITGTTWYGDSVELTVPNDTAMFYVDFGFMSKIDSASLYFGEYAEKGEIEVYASTDGYNFTYYAGSSSDYNDTSWSISFDSLYCKALMFSVPLEYNSTLTLSELEVKGVKDAEKQLLSVGATYVWEGTGHRIYAENEELPGKLTDKTVFDGKNDSCLLGVSGKPVKDEITGKSGSVITFDLQSVKNISELDFGIYKTPATTMPDRICVRYSEDGENWSDFGQSYLRTSDGRYKNTSYRYTVTRNHTVKARYVKLYLYVSAILILDEVSIYGNENEIAEPDYGFTDMINNLSNTNVAAYKPALLNGMAEPRLTDMDHTVAVNSQTGENEIELDLAAKTSDVCAVMLYTSTAELKDIKLSVYTDGAYSSPIAISSSASVAGSTVWYLFFNKTDAEKIKISFTSEKAVKIYEAAVYASRPQLPVVKGGFFQLSTSGGVSDACTMNSDYSWYLQLKGMRDLGMEYVVIQYSTHYKAKTTLINGVNIKAQGYTYSQTYGTEDVCKAVLDAAEKLGMKVWLGTIHDSDFTSPVANMSQYEAIVEDSYAIIDDINEMYGDYPAFAGYYLSDETCDQWLNQKGGVEACRYVYKSQSDYIRSIDEDALIMIAPAIWRSGAASVGADNLYKMLVPENEGDKPVVDIVAAQDCLGRTDPLKVEDYVYRAYETYVDKWAKAIRRAGCEFWHDAEVFEIVSLSKRCECVIESLTIEAKTSGSIIVFDIPHYFTTFPMTAYNQIHGFYKMNIMLQYVKYYSKWAQPDAISGTQPSVITDDGREV